MTYTRNKKALSPLVATAILLSAAMAGGILLYQYFNTTLNNYTQGENIVLTTLAQDTGTGKTLFYYSIQNTGTTSIKLVKIDVYKGEDIVHTIQLNNTSLSPGEKITGTSIAGTLPSPGMYAILTIDVNGNTVITKPSTVSLS